MRVVVQRVKYSSCTIDGVVTGKCGKGFMLLIGFKTTDTLAELEKCAKKTGKDHHFRRSLSASSSRRQALVIKFIIDLSSVQQ